HGRLPAPGPPRGPTKPKKAPPAMSSSQRATPFNLKHWPAVSWARRSCPSNTSTTWLRNTPLEAWPASLRKCSKQPGAAPDCRAAPTSYNRTTESALIPVPSQDVACETDHRGLYWFLSGSRLAGVVLSGDCA